MQELRRLVHQRDHVARRRQVIDSQIAAKVKELQDEGYSMSSLAEFIGLTRQGLYDLIARAQKRDETGTGSGR